MIGYMGFLEQEKQKTAKIKQNSSKMELECVFSSGTMNLPLTHQVITTFTLMPWEARLVILG